MPFSPLLVERYALVTASAALPIETVTVDGVIAYAAEGGFAAGFTGQVDGGLVRLRPAIGWPLPTVEVAVQAGTSVETTLLTVYAEVSSSPAEVAQPPAGPGPLTLSAPLSRGGDDLAVERASPVADAVAVLRSHPVSARRAGHQCWPELGSQHHALRLSTPDPGYGLSVALAALEEALPGRAFNLSGDPDNIRIEVIS